MALCPTAMQNMDCVGIFIDTVNNEFKLRNLSRLPKGKAEDLQALGPEDVKRQQSSAAELESQVAGCKITKVQYLSHLAVYFREIARNSGSDSAFDRAAALQHYQEKLLSWLESNRPDLERLDAALRKEKPLEGNSLHNGISGEYLQKMAELETKVRKLLGALVQLERRRTPEGSTGQTVSSELQLFEKALQDVQAIKRQSAVLTQYSVPLLPQSGDADLEGRLEKMRNQIQELRTRQRDCGTGIDMLRGSVENAFKDIEAEPESPTPPSTLPKGAIMTHLKFSADAIIHDALKKMTKEFLQTLSEDLPPGDRNPNEQYAWKLLQRTLLLLKAETQTVSFQRDDPYLIGPQFLALYSM